MENHILPDNTKFHIVNGYICFYDKTHPLQSCYRVYLHRHLKSIQLGRWVTTDEVVHHIDGNKENNDLANLELVSVSEHAKLHNKERGYISSVIVRCERSPCTNITMNKKYCSNKCSGLAKLKIPLTKEELEKLIWEFPFTEIAKKYGVTGNGVKKRAATLGCNMPPPYYHNRKKA